MPVLAVTAIGADRPGIVARVTGVLLEHGGNLEDSSMTVLGGQFAVVLLVDSATDPAVLESALGDATRDLGLLVSVRPVGAGAPRRVAATHVVSVYGADRPGIVHTVAAGLAARDCSVTDLVTRVLPGDPPVYVLQLEIAVPAGADPDALAAALRGNPVLAEVAVSVQPLDADAF
jgi:glycine cleavage system transcriptional repressor